MSNHLQSRLLVTGASGQLGRRVAELLLDAGAKNLTLASRTPEKLAEFAARGAKTVKADFDDSASLEAAFAGIERALIISTDAVMVPGQRIAQHKAAVEAAAKAGVGRIVYTSMIGPEPGSPIPFAPDHHGTEQAIEKSGVPYTILRVSWYSDNTLRWLPQAVASGRWVTAAGEGRVAHVPREDVARAAAAALSGDGGESVRLDVTGPAALTTAEIAAAANEALGSSIEVVPVGEEEYAKGLKEANLPPPVVDLMVGMERNTREGRIDVASDTVKRLTGKPAQGLRDFLAARRDQIAPAK